MANPGPKIIIFDPKSTSFEGNMPQGGGPGGGPGGSRTRTPIGTHIGTPIGTPGVNQRVTRGICTGTPGVYRGGLYGTHMGPIWDPYGTHMGPI